MAASARYAAPRNVRLHSAVTRPRLAVTLGDARGIGPEVVARALADAAVRDAAEWVVVGPPAPKVTPAVSIGEWKRSSVARDAGQLAGLAIERAAAMAIAGEVAGVVTAPIDKHALAARWLRRSGPHGDASRDLPVNARAMMLASDKLRVVLATTHIALRDVPAAVHDERHHAGRGNHEKGIERLVWHRRAAPRAVRAQSARR